jgi:hypothetical protein
MAQPPSIRNFVDLLLPSWSAAMSGPLSVPLAVLAFFVSNETAKVLLGLSSFACVWAASYVLWSRERTERNKSDDKKLKGSLRFARAIRQEGDAGAYSAYATVQNTSLALKMTNCRCEIAELQDAHGQPIERNVGLRTRSQQEQESGGRFNLDQGSEKDIPVFELLQLQERPGPGLYIIGAGTNNIKLEFGVYTARVRAYGDSGQPDEITIKVDCRASPFCTIT